MPFCFHLSEIYQLWEGNMLFCHMSGEHPNKHRNLSSPQYESCQNHIPSSQPCKSNLPFCPLTYPGSDKTKLDNMESKDLLVSCVSLNSIIASKSPSSSHPHRNWGFNEISSTTSINICGETEEKKGLLKGGWAKFKRLRAWFTCIKPRPSFQPQYLMVPQTVRRNHQHRGRSGP